MLRINRFVVVSADHSEIILDHDYDCLYRSDVLSTFLQCQADLDDMDYHITLKKDWQACHLRVNNVRFAVFINVVALSAADSLYMVTFLKRFSELFKDLCGTVDSLTLERNLLLLMEIIGCTLINGYVQLMNPAKVKAYLTIDPQLHSPRIEFPLKDPTPSSNVQNASALLSTVKKAAPDRQSDTPPVSLGLAGGPLHRPVTQLKTSEVFVDVIEKMSAVIGMQGAPSFASIDGEIKLRSLTSGPLKLHLAFDHLPSAFESVTFNSAVSNDHGSDFMKTGLCSLHVDGSEKSIIAMTYRMNCLGVPPFQLHRETTTRGNPICIALKLENRLPPEVLCVNVQVAHKLPGGYSVRNRTSDVSISDDLLTWSLSKLRGGVPCETTMEIAAPESLEKANVEEAELFAVPTRLSFEMSNFLISGMVLRSVKLETSTARGTKKWIRTITVSQVYEQKL